jgi:hypothetical protein
MTRKTILFFVCLGISATAFAVAVFLTHHEALTATLPFKIIGGALVVPVMLPLLAFAKLTGIAVSEFWLLTVVAGFWLFPVGRASRWFGTFDAFRGDTGRLPSFSRSAAVLLDILNRLKVGKGKMGGWA